MRKLRKKEVLARRLSEELEGASPEEIVRTAQKMFSPSAVFVGYSGGFDSLVTTHWAMNNVEGCKVFHANTGIGIERTREFVRGTCRENGWPLTEIRAKEDCGQDYDALVLERGFPGPGHHYKMFQRLKERPIMKLLRDNKLRRTDNVMLLTGIRKDESARRGGYKYTVLDFTGNLLWVNPFYYRGREWFEEYLALNKIERNPVSATLGMSGECLCGAYAHKGELSLIKIVCPETHARIVALEEKVRQTHGWGWEDRPPKNRKTAEKAEKFMPFCVGCEK